MSSTQSHKAAAQAKCRARDAGAPNRRETLQLLGAGAAMLAFGRSGLGAVSDDALLPPEQRWITLLTEGIADEKDSLPTIEGQLPLDLVGTLYRNGPGLFERDNYRKSTLLDGDGMIRAFTFAAGSVRFRNRFVATEKYQRESAAHRFLFPTWTTPAPAFFENLPEIPARSQAGITAVVKNGTLYAFDEVGLPYALDPDSLATLKQLDPRGAQAENSPRAYKAHTKTDGKTGAWILAGTSGQPRQQLHAIVIYPDGRQLQVSTPNPRGDYFHDFFWTGRHVVFHLHPTPLAPFPMLMGLRTYVDSLSWRPELGSILLVVDPSGSETPVRMEIPASWMWHAVNAYEQGNTIIADFIGYDAPDHFFGPRAALRTVMSGRAGIAASSGMLRRAIVDMNRRSAHLETLLGEHCEFPTVSPRVQGCDYSCGYSAIGDINRSWFHDGVVKVDLKSGKHEEFRFGSHCYVGEPVFVPRRNARAEDAGWLLCEVLDGHSARSELAILDAQTVAAGPIARVKFNHSLPFSFHGWWQPA